ncbi:MULTISPECIES: hypothetical protein [Paraburkholderia]|uniref:Uncharacterized protein n=1 Tax=Paraburkholderia podalyriae TaxID=1938811 RepID=A0ABR7PYY0_9BURK|nr:hypothetical protein [Paraburkholderia podalyriae]MBC8751447.1 hypothetical protein [Paraburkholderia podalyriae]
MSAEILIDSDLSLPETEGAATSSESYQIPESEDIVFTVKRLEKLLVKVERENKILLHAFRESVFGKKAVDVGNPLIQYGEPVWREELNRLANPGSVDSTLPKQTRHLLIPIHLPKIFHISSIFSFLSKAELDTEDVRVTLVATGTYEREVIERYLEVAASAVPRHCEVISALEVTEAAGWTRLGDALAKNQGGGCINMKKLLSVCRAFALGADQVCCIDADTLLLKSLDSFFDQIETNYAKKTFFSAGSPIDITKSTYRASANFFSPRDEGKLDGIYGSDRYSWFFDIPFYAREDFFEFLQHVAFLYGGVDEAWARLTWNHFDHILYVNYLLLRGDFKLVDLVPIVGDGKITDDLDLSHLDRVQDIHEYRPVWLTLTAATQDDTGGKQCVSRGFSAIYHVDRVSSLSDA